MEFIVSKDENKERLDVFLNKKIEGITRSYLKNLIQDGSILVNGEIKKSGYSLKENDKIVVNIPDDKTSDIVPEDIKLDIIYEDDDVIIINKNKGMVVHPANGNYTGTMVNSLMYSHKDNLSSINGVIRPGIVHRIDKDTSGILVVAKNDKAHINMSEQIKNHEVEKTYIALVKGFVKEEEATINMPIGRSTKDRKKMAVNKNGKNAVTHFKVLKRFKNYTLLEVKIETGRTHQIRVHLSEIGYPVVGDTVYSNGKNEWGIKGQCLHAKSLKFKHPITGKEMFIEAPLPKYFENILKDVQ